jgi:hypothetical protein
MPQMKTLGDPILRLKISIIDTAEHDGDLPLTTSAILDTSEVSISSDITSTNTA